MRKQTAVVVGGWSATIARYLAEGRGVSGGSTSTTVHPLTGHAAAGNQLVGERMTSNGKKILDEGTPKECLDMSALGKLIVETVDWTKAQTRQGSGAPYQTTGALQASVAVDGYTYTVGLSVTRKQAKAGFSLSPEETDEAIADIQNLTQKGILSPAEGERKIARLRK